MNVTLIRGLMVFGFALGALAASASISAQPTAPIYVQYEGFKHERDGGYVLWFSYFNLNHVDVTIPLGPDNEFSPAPGTRNQPTRFHKGRHRFACTMVVPPGTAEPVQWTVKFAGNTSTTTARVFDPIYELEEASVELGSKGLDATTAPLGVCVERSLDSDS
jgi:hypothetical protein